MDRKLSVVIPCYQEEKRLPSTLREIELFCQKYPGRIAEVWIVDDGSRDRTVERAMYFLQRIPLRFVRLAKNEGKWAAIVEGLKHVERENCVLLMDADGSASIWELEKIEVPGKHVALFGSRFIQGSSVENKSFLRTLVSRGYRGYALFWYWFATGKSDIDDMQCPFKLFYVEDLRWSVEVKRFAGDIALAASLKSKKKNVPIEFVHKRGSKVPMSAAIQMGIETIKVARNYRKKYRDSRK